MTIIKSIPVAIWGMTFSIPSFFSGKTELSPLLNKGKITGALLLKDCGFSLHWSTVGWSKPWQAFSNVPRITGCDLEIYSKLGVVDHPVLDFKIPP